MIPRSALFSLTIAAICLPLLCARASQTVGERQRLESITKKLTSEEFRSRAFKTDSGRKAAEYIGAQFREAGLKPPAGSADFSQAIAGGGQNVAGVIEGQDAALKNEYVLVGTHYDNFGAPFVGAVDNAAGVAVMAEVARALAKKPPRRGVLFLAFDGGEQNDAGARYYADHPLVSLEKTAAMVNLSGFGGGMSEKFYETLYATGAEFSPQLREAAGKYKNGEAHLALVGRDVTKWPGCEHYGFILKRTPTITITNGVHYSQHSKADIPDRVNYAALEKHAAALAKVIAEIADTPGKIEKSAQPAFDADEAAEWRSVLSALRENVLKGPENDAGRARIDDVLFELQRHQGRAVQDPKAREAVILPAANIVFFIANPSGVQYNSLLNTAQNFEQDGRRLEAIAAYQKLLKFIDEEYRRDDRTVGELRQRLLKLQNGN